MGASYRIGYVLFARYGTREATSLSIRGCQGKTVVF